MTERRALKALKRRVDFLIQRIVNESGSEKALAYDVGEKNAIIWLLEEAGYLEQFNALYEEVDDE